MNWGFLSEKSTVGTGVDQSDTVCKQEAQPLCVYRRGEAATL